MAFPIQRLRRLRRTETLRRLVRETTLHVDDLIAMHDGKRYARESDVFHLRFDVGINRGEVGGGRLWPAGKSR